MIKFSKKTIIFAVVFLLLVLTPVALNQYYSYLLAPPAPKNQEETLFIVTPGQPLETIAQNLEKKKLIKSAFAFRLLIAQMGIGKSIQAGDFKMAPNMTARDIAKELTHGAIDIWVTLPEGLRVEEQAERIEAKLKFGQNDQYKFDKKQYIKIAKEGYMFSDTYLIAKNATAADVAARLSETFSEKVEQSILDKAKSELSNEEIITLASLIEKEAKTSEEKPTIAGIIVNRLNAGIALQIDATVAYAKGYDSAKNSWWGEVTTDDYKTVKSPYNTYLKPGPPPGPIANPGIDSIRAALEPADTPYLYYLHDSEGRIHYAKTIEEHNQNIQNFL